MKKQPHGARFVWFGITAIVVYSALASYARSETIVVNNDMGGLIRERVQEINEIQRQKDRVKIKGRFCYSTCTMFLIVDDMCVSPYTRFGFHGPSYYGKPLSPDRFAYWSNVMASHYPEPIRNWFLSTVIAKESTTVLMGSDLIRLGFEEC